MGFGNYCFVNTPSQGVVVKVERADHNAIMFGMLIVEPNEVLTIERYHNALMLHSKRQHFIVRNCFASITRFRGGQHIMPKHAKRGDNAQG